MEKARKHRINISETSREAPEEEVKKREKAELHQTSNEAASILQKIPEDEIIRAMRDRETSTRRSER